MKVDIKKKNIKKIMYMLVSLLLISFILAGCSEATKATKDTTSSSKPQTSQSTGEKTSKYKFAIYMVKDLSTTDVSNKSLDDLVLEEEPIFAETNIHAYYWKSNVIIIDKNIIDERLMKTIKTSGTPFVVVANGERIYLGYFWTALSSVSPPQDMPIVNILPGAPILEQLKYDGYDVTLKSDETYLEIEKPFIGDDKRNNKKIYDALKETEILK